MATVTALTASASLDILNATITGADIDGSGHLILTTHDGSTIDAGAIRGSFDGATTSAAGIVQLATDAEAAAGTDAAKVVTPHALGSVVTTINTAISGKQPSDPDLTAFAALTPAASDILQYISSAWVNRTMAQLKTSLALVKADVGLGSVDNTADTAKPVSTAQAAADALKANIASPSFTGLVTIGGALTSPSDALTDGSTINTDASTGNYFRVTLAGNRTLAKPTNLVDGQTLTFEIIQDATGSRTLTLNAAFSFGTDITSATFSTTATKRDFLTVRYNSTADKLYVLGFLKGY